MDPVSITEAARRLGVSREEIQSRIRKGELESRQMSTATGVGMGVVLPDDGPRPTGGQPLQAGGGITTPPMQGWTGQAQAATPPPQPPVAQPPPAQPPPVQPSPPAAQPPRPQPSPGQVTPPVPGWEAQTPAATPPLRAAGCASARAGRPNGPASERRGAAADASDSRAHDRDPSGGDASDLEATAARSGADGSTAHWRDGPASQGRAPATAGPLAGAGPRTARTAAQTAPKLSFA